MNESRHSVNIQKSSPPPPIGSVLSGKIRDSSDIDPHVYCYHYSEIQSHLQTFHYTDIETEYVENQKGTFVHLRWLEQHFPIEITIHHWNDRQKIMISSITQLPMKRATLQDLRKLLATHE